MNSPPDILARIVERKRQELAERALPRAELERRAEALRAERRDFRAALLRETPSVIAEVKRASPSKGPLADNVDPARLGAQYERGGAAALSVLTDRDFFRGSLEDLRAARSAVSVPVLRKEFVIDEYQVVESAANGADSILLIAAILEEESIRRLAALAREYAMESLVEVHDEEELKVALAAGAGVVGVNNRDLRSFEVTLETSLRLAGMIPAGVVKVSESGIHTRADVERLHAAGYDAFLVGEHLVKSADPSSALRALVGR